MGLKFKFDVSTIANAGQECHAKKNRRIKITRCESANPHSALSVHRTYANTRQENRNVMSAWNMFGLYPEPRAIASLSELGKRNRNAADGVPTKQGTFGSQFQETFCWAKFRKPAPEDNDPSWL